MEGGVVSPILDNAWKSPYIALGIPKIFRIEMRNKWCIVLNNSRKVSLCTVHQKHEGK